MYFGMWYKLDIYCYLIIITLRILVNSLHFQTIYIVSYLVIPDPRRMKKPASYGLLDPLFYWNVDVQCLHKIFLLVYFLIISWIGTCFPFSPDMYLLTYFWCMTHNTQRCLWNIGQWLANFLDEFRSIIYSIYIFVIWFSGF